MSTSQTPIDELVKQITAVAYSGKATAREIAIAIEARQAYIDYLDLLKDNAPPEDYGVTIEVDGTRIRFEDDDSFENWLADVL